jgi:hypothetical protein
MRHLICTLIVFAIAAALFIAWEQRPPSSRGSRSNILLQPGPTVPAFFYGAFDFDGNPPAIAYFVRISSEADLAAPMSWLEEHEGRIFVEGRRVLPREGMIQMYVADGPGNPRLVLLADENRQAFLEFLNAAQNFESGARFWNDVISAH